MHVQSNGGWLGGWLGGWVAGWCWPAGRSAQTPPPPWLAQLHGESVYSTSHLSLAKPQAQWSAGLLLQTRSYHLSFVRGHSMPPSFFNHLCLPSTPWHKKGYRVPQVVRNLLACTTQTWPQTVPFPSMVLKSAPNLLCNVVSTLAVLCNQAHIGEIHTRSGLAALHFVTSRRSEVT